MPKHHWFISFFACLNLTAIAVGSVSAQALLPYTLDLNSEHLEAQGQELIEDAIQLVRFQQYDLALPYAKLSTQLASEDYESWFVLGSLLSQQENFDEAIIALQRAYNLNPNEAGILLSLGSVYFQKQDYEMAAQKLEAALSLNPEAIDGLFDLGNTYLLLKRYSEAIEVYQKSVNIEPQFWPSINNIGLVHYEQGNPQKAIEYWQQATAVDDQATEPNLAIAVAWYSLGQKDKAFALAESALSLDPRYADLEFLRENLWGDRLLADTKIFLETPQIQALLEELPIPDPEF